MFISTSKEENNREKKEVTPRKLKKKRDQKAIQECNTSYKSETVER